MCPLVRLAHANRYRLELKRIIRMMVNGIEPVWRGTAAQSCNLLLSEFAGHKVCACRAVRCG